MPLAQARFAAALVFLALVYQPLWTAFRTGGQTTTIVLFLLTLAAIAFYRDRVNQGVLCFALAAMIKPVLISAVAFFAIVSGFGMLKRLFWIFALFGVVSLMALGWEVHLEFLRVMVEGLGKKSPWYWNSSLFTVFDNLSLLGREGFADRGATLLAFLQTVLRLPFVGTYRTLCLAPDPRFARVLTEIRHSMAAA